MGRILPEVDLDMAAWTVKQLTARGMDIRLNTRLESISPLGMVRLSDGEEFPSDTLVWTAGTKPNPAGKATGAKGGTARPSTPRPSGSTAMGAGGDGRTTPPSERARKRTGDGGGDAAPSPSQPTN